MGFTPATHPESAVPAGSGCHETEPVTPNAPDQGHVCCGGDHSPDALLSAANTATIPMIAQGLQIPVLELAIQDRLFAVTVSPSAGPPVPFALRI